MGVMKNGGWSKCPVLYAPLTACALPCLCRHGRRTGDPPSHPTTLVTVIRLTYASTDSVAFVNTVNHSPLTGSDGRFVEFVNYDERYRKTQQEIIGKFRNSILSQL